MLWFFCIVSSTYVYNSSTWTVDFSYFFNPEAWHWEKNPTFWSFLVQASCSQLFLTMPAKHGLKSNAMIQKQLFPWAPGNLFPRTQWEEPERRAREPGVTSCLEGLGFVFFVFVCCLHHIRTSGATAEVRERVLWNVGSPGGWSCQHGGRHSPWLITSLTEPEVPVGAGRGGFLGGKNPINAGSDCLLQDSPHLFKVLESISTNIPI